MDNDTHISIVNPEGVAYSLRPAGFVSRALAYVVDSLIISTVYGIGVAIFLAAGIDTGSWLQLLMVFVMQWFYFTIWEVKGRGSTPGKRLLGLKVVGDDGSPVSPGASFTRNLLRFADTFLGLYLIGFLTMMFSPGFRRLGDWAASTLVVTNKPVRGASPAGVFVPAVNSRVPEYLVQGEDKIALISFFRRYHYFGKNRADEIARGIVPLLSSRQEDRDEPCEYLLSLGKGLTEGEGFK